MKIEFTAYGEAKPAGSKTGFVVKDKKTGKHRAIVVDASKGNKPWQAIVSSAALESYHGALLRCALSVTFRFYFPRPKCHYGTGRNASKLKPDAPAFLTKAPDVLKLSRGVEDALSGIVYVDDSQIVMESISKHYGEPARVEVVVQPLTPTTPQQGDGT
jgi:Holliday junction resolvase RusA-like endonuclease